MPSSRYADPAEPLRRLRLLELLAGIEPGDATEDADITGTAEWVASGAPLYRVRKPDVPAKHLVSYFVPIDPASGQLMLVAHRATGLWLPPGGHVEPAEDPWRTVRRECREELGIEATPAPFAGERPVFLTVSQTRGAGPHIDVSLWYALAVDPRTIQRYDVNEFAEIRWVSPDRLLDEPVETLDPHLHRFTRKLLRAGWPVAPSRVR